MTAGIARILLIDDEAAIRKFVRIGLTAQQCEIIEAASAAEGLRLLSARRPELVILDLGLPDADGQDVIDAIRAVSAVPIIVLSVRAEEREKISALDRGASDYVTKPFGLGELTARIRALLRDRQPGHAPQTSYDAGPLHLDVARHEATLRGESLKLSPKEFDLLALLLANRGRMLTHRQLLREIWGPAHEQDTQYLRVYVAQLRQKLGDDPSAPHFIANEPGVGYRFLDPA
jgi:two-component system, OmpR family, KDP operon response regulator KdpE